MSGRKITADVIVGGMDAARQHGREAERASIVKWLRHQATMFRAMRLFAPAELREHIADTIERAAHLELEGL